MGRKRRSDGALLLPGLFELAVRLFVETAGRRFAHHAVDALPAEATSSVVDSDWPATKLVPVWENRSLADWSAP
jgi:hypothetical protein